MPTIYGAIRAAIVDTVLTIPFSGATKFGPRSNKFNIVPAELKP